MTFTAAQIKLACHLKSLGLPWEPAVGHYVYDVTHAVKPTSPFQDHVYFLLNFDCFMQRVGGIERFKRLMVWLPTWHDTREILRRLGCPNHEVQRRILAASAIERESELLLLYEMIAQRLEASGAAQLPDRLHVC